MARSVPVRRRYRKRKTDYNDELFVSATKIIKSLANRYGQFLAPTALFTRDDLEQEGWEVFIKLMRKRYNSDRAKITTLLYSSVMKRYNSILRYESQKGRSQPRADFESVISEASVDSNHQDHAAMLMQALEAFAQVNIRFAQLLVDGPAPALLAEARALARLRCAKRGIDPATHALIITPKFIRNFFAENFRALDVDLLQRLANNYL